MITTSSSFDKESFKKVVKEQVKVLYRKTLQEATPQQIYQAVCYAVKDTIIDNWMKTQKAMEVQDPKTVYYMSMEFLMGRLLTSNMQNLGIYEVAKEGLADFGIEIGELEAMMS